MTKELFFREAGYQVVMHYAQKLLRDKIITASERDDFEKLVWNNQRATQLHQCIQTSTTQLQNNYSSLLTEYFEKYNLSNPFRQVKLVKQEEVLHKPIKDIKLVFEELRLFNSNLHLCCLLAYGCLLRPHREIRNLKWSNFDDDCTFISLSGSQNKGKKNRIVPIPKFVQQYIVKGNDEHNIFTHSEQVYNEFYFNGKAIDTDYQPNTCKANLKDKQIRFTQ